MTSSRRPPKRTRSRMSDQDVQQLLNVCDDQIASTTTLLEEASEICAKIGERITSDLSAIHAATTAGHSNTDHVVVWTQDYETNRIAELKRNMLNRVRARQPECRGEDRWDKPRTAGERRRRIARDRDAPEAPMEPPMAGYIIYVGQMTTKLRHDRPHIPHNQTAVVQEISKLWRIALSDADREFYVQFSEEARKEYDLMHLEYRATGTFRPSRKFQRLEGVGPWIHKQPQDRNALEREIASYQTVQFPPRPKELDEAYERRQEESKRRRKLKLQGLLNPDGTVRTEPLPEVLNANRRRRRRRKLTVHNQITDETAAGSDGQSSKQDDDEAAAAEAAANNNEAAGSDGQPRQEGDDNDDDEEASSDDQSRQDDNDDDDDDDAAGCDGQSKHDDEVQETLANEQAEADAQCQQVKVGIETWPSHYGQAKHDEEKGFTPQQLNDDSPETGIGQTTETLLDGHNEALGAQSWDQGGGEKCPKGDDEKADYDEAAGEHPSSADHGDNSKAIVHDDGEPRREGPDEKGG
ncbi:hypothetical protein ACA910_012719 [Epithemia clementina (nom. ined.)]